MAAEQDGFRTSPAPTLSPQKVCPSFVFSCECHTWESVREAFMEHLPYLVQVLGAWGLSSHSPCP